MALPLQILGYVAAISLQVLILFAMRGDARRRYPFVFLYVLADLITNLIEIQPNLAHDTGTIEQKRRWLWIYWWDERVMQALLFLMVISLIYVATKPGRQRRTLVTWSVLGSLTFAGISLLLHYNSSVTTGKWMTRWTRDMNFCATVLDLILWATLLSARQRDRRILMISGALGLQFTAGAIGQALRDLSHAAVDMTSILIVAANLSCLFIWWQAFRTPVAVSAAGPVQTQKEPRVTRGSSV